MLNMLIMYLQLRLAVDHIIPVYRTGINLYHGIPIRSSVLRYTPVKFNSSVVCSFFCSFLAYHLFHFFSVFVSTCLNVSVCLSLSLFLILFPYSSLILVSRWFPFLSLALSWFLSVYLISVCLAFFLHWCCMCLCSRHFSRSKRAMYLIFFRNIYKKLY